MLTPLPLSFLGSVHCLVLPDHLTSLYLQDLNSSPGGAHSSPPDESFLVTIHGRCPGPLLSPDGHPDGLAGSCPPGPLATTPASQLSPAALALPSPSSSQAQPLLSLVAGPAGLTCMPVPVLRLCPLSPPAGHQHFSQFCTGCSSCLPLA